MDSLQKPNPLDLEQTVLSIISSDDIPSSTLESLFTNKTKVLKSTIKELFGEIILRFQVDKDIFTGIDDDICQCDTLLDEIKSHLGRGYDIEKVLAFMPKRTQLESLILDLNKQKRTEALECWRDLMFIKKYLMSALSEYWTLSKRQQLLSSDIDENEQH